MALSTSNQPLFFPTISSSKPSKPIQHVKFTTLALHNRFHFCKQNLGFHLPIAVKNNTREPCFKSFRATGDSASTVEDDEKASGQEASLKALILAYKKAVFEGDRDTLLEIEAGVELIENERNKLVEQVSTLTAEIKSGKERYIRLQADFDNFRKRSEKERLNTRSDAQGEVIENLLLMVDSFERAKEHIKPETEREKKIDASYQGIYKQFVEIMRSLNVAAVPTVGKPFDPNVHEAISREESKEFKEGIVIKELRRGFRLGDRLLRPAMVKVSAGPGKKAFVGTEKTTGQSAATAGVDEQ